MSLCRGRDVTLLVLFVVIRPAMLKAKKMPVARVPIAVKMSTTFRKGILLDLA
jgi:hypothetical protein